MWADIKGCRAAEHGWVLRVVLRYPWSARHQCPLAEQGIKTTPSLKPAVIIILISRLETLHGWWDRISNTPKIIVVIIVVMARIVMLTLI